MCNLSYFTHKLSRYFPGKRIFPWLSRRSKKPFQMGCPIMPKLLLRMMAYCSCCVMWCCRRLKTSPSRLRFSPSWGGCRREISSSVHFLRGGRLQEAFFEDISLSTASSEPASLCENRISSSLSSADPRSPQKINRPKKYIAGPLFSLTNRISGDIVSYTSS